MKNFKNKREFTFKAYGLNKGEQFLTNIHKGEFVFKSDCHYYVEKFILDLINANAKNDEILAKNYLIYKISTLEDSNIEDLLIESITVNDGKIIIK